MHEPLSFKECVSHLVASLAVWKSFCFWNGWVNVFVHCVSVSSYTCCRSGNLVFLFACFSAYVVSHFPFRAVNWKSSIPIHACVCGKTESVWPEHYLRSTPCHILTPFVFDRWLASKSLCARRWRLALMYERSALFDKSAMSLRFWQPSIMLGSFIWSVLCAG